MLISDINNRITLRTKASLSDYTYQQRTLSINNWLNRLNNWILQSQDESDNADKNNTTFSESYTNLVANQNNYSLPSECTRVKRLEISYDGVSFKRAVPIDVGEIDQATKDSDTASKFTTSNPRYDIINNSIVIYPTPSADVADGLNVWYDELFTPLSYTSETSNDILTGTKVLGFDSNFHELIELGASYDWNSSKLGDKSLMQDITAMQAEIFRFYASKQKDRQYAFGAAYVDYE
jgi:hypothetical protein